MGYLEQEVPNNVRCNGCDGATLVLTGGTQCTHCGTHAVSISLQYLVKLPFSTVLRAKLTKLPSLDRANRLNTNTLAPGDHRQ